MKRFHRIVGVLDGLMVLRIFEAFQAQYLLNVDSLGDILHKFLSEHEHDANDQFKAVFAGLSLSDNEGWLLFLRMNELLENFSHILIQILSLF